MAWGPWPPSRGAVASSFLPSLAFSLPPTSARAEQALEGVTSPRGSEWTGLPPTTVSGPRLARAGTAGPRTHEQRPTSLVVPHHSKAFDFSA